MPAFTFKFFFSQWFSEEFKNNNCRQKAADIKCKYDIKALRGAEIHSSILGARMKSRFIFPGTSKFIFIG